MLIDHMVLTCFVLHSIEYMGVLTCPVVWMDYGGGGGGGGESTSITSFFLFSFLHDGKFECLLPDRSKGHNLLPQKKKKKAHVFVVYGCRLLLSLGTSFPM